MEGEERWEAGGEMARRAAVSEGKPKVERDFICPGWRLVMLHHHRGEKH